MIALLESTNTGTVLTAIGVITIIVIVVGQIVLFIAALVSVLASRRYTGGGKLLWLLLVFFMPFLGAIGWFLLGKNAQIRTDTP